jgi:hypothetical protein
LQALIVLNELKTITGDSTYVFPSPARQNTPHLHRDALSKALRDMGFQGKHATHGFRGMLRTVGRARLGIDIDVLEAQLAGQRNAATCRRPMTARPSMTTAAESCRSGLITSTVVYGAKSDEMPH